MSDRICEADGCDRPFHARGYCAVHYARMRKTGELVAVNLRLMGSPESRLWIRVDRGAADECWPWTGGVTQDGYGRIRVGQGRVLAHRLAYELTYGPVPDGRIVCHTCDNPPCCNPSHLWIGTDQDNATDKVAKGRSSRGERSYNAKITEDAVRAIRADPRLYRLIAADYGISAGNVGNIKAFRAWRHVK